MDKLVLWKEELFGGRKMGIYRVVNDTESLTISFFDSKTDEEMDLVYSGVVPVYRDVEELSALRYINELSEVYGSELLTSTFFEVKESAMISEIVEGSYEVIKPGHLFHLKIISVDFITDIISHEEPEIRWK